MRELDKLKISRRIIDAARPRRGVESLDYRRRKLIANLEEQLELAELAIKGNPLELQRKRGRSVVKVRPRIWWKQDDDGHVATQVRYNKKALALKGRGTTIEVGALQDLPGVYRTLIAAVNAGELDNAIDVSTASEARQRRSR